MAILFTHNHSRSEGTDSSRPNRIFARFWFFPHDVVFLACIEQSSSKYIDFDQIVSILSAC